jgi:hypothetical protein
MREILTESGQQIRQMLDWRQLSVTVTEGSDCKFGRCRGRAGRPLYMLGVIGCH